MTGQPKVIVLTPIKDAAHFLPGYVERIQALNYPKKCLSLGWLEGDSKDDTFETARDLLPGLRSNLRSAELWTHDFGFDLGEVPRWTPEIQLMRRAVLAKSRNMLLFRALADHDWVLWLDVDVIEYPTDLIERLLAVGADIVHPNCVLEYGGPSFDRNAWRDRGKFHLDDLRCEGPIVSLDSVGGTVLFVRADVHREGAIFPAVPYGLKSSRCRPRQGGEIETEGFGILAGEMGYASWGMTDLEVLHARD